MMTTLCSMVSLRSVVVFYYYWGGRQRVDIFCMDIWQPTRKWLGSPLASAVACRPKHVPLVLNGAKLAS